MTESFDEDSARATLVAGLRAELAALAAQVDAEVPWYRAPIPRRWHRCRPQTTATVPQFGETVSRCGCGGMMFHDDPVWFQRNTRKR